MRKSEIAVVILMVTLTIFLVIFTITHDKPKITIAPLIIETSLDCKKYGTENNCCPCGYYFSPSNAMCYKKAPE